MLLVGELGSNILQLRPNTAKYINIKKKKKKRNINQMKGTENFGDAILQRVVRDIL